MQGYIQGAKERQQGRNDILEERRARAWVVAKDSARILREKYGATEVILFGSLTGKTIFHARSDVDLAVWGIPESKYYKAVAELLTLDLDIQVDLVIFEDARSELQKVIQSQGVPL